MRRTSYWFFVRLTGAGGLNQVSLLVQADLGKVAILGQKFPNSAADEARKLHYEQSFPIPGEPPTALSSLIDRADNRRETDL